MDNKEWRNRYKNRNDMTSRITYLTKGNDSEEVRNLKLLYIGVSEE